MFSFFFVYFFFVLFSFLVSDVRLWSPGLLRHQPDYSWSVRWGNAGTTTGIHADEFGITYSSIAVLSGVKRVFLFHKHKVGDKYHGKVFPVVLSTKDKKFLSQCGGYEEVTIKAGEILLFQSAIPHAVTNIRDNTFCAVSLVLTYNTLSNIIKDCKRMPSQEAELLWYGSVLYALYKELKYHMKLEVKNIGVIRRLAYIIRTSLSRTLGKRGGLISQFRLVNLTKIRTVLKDCRQLYLL